MKKKKTEKWHSITLEQNGGAPVFYTTEFIDGEPYRVEYKCVNGKMKILSKIPSKNLICKSESITTEHPYDIQQKGLKYDALKEQYDKLETRYNESYASRLKVDAQRDELLEICQLVMKSDIDGSYIVASNWWLKMKDLIKSIKNEP